VFLKKVNQRSYYLSPRVFVTILTTIFFFSQWSSTNVFVSEDDLKLKDAFLFLSSSSTLISSNAESFRFDDDDDSESLFLLNGSRVIYYLSAQIKWNSKILLDNIQGLWFLENPCVVQLWNFFFGYKFKCTLKKMEQKYVISQFFGWKTQKKHLYQFNFFILARSHQFWKLLTFTVFIFVFFVISFNLKTIKRSRAFSTKILFSVYFTKV